MRKITKHNKKIIIWYDEEAGLLEVIFKRKAGYFTETDNDAVMKRIDNKGNVLGFMVEMGALKAKNHQAASLSFIL